MTQIDWYSQRPAEAHWVDPRSMGSESCTPPYRVDFFDTAQGNAESNWILTGADLPDVLSWIERHRRPTEVVVVYALIRMAGDSGPTHGIRLFGSDPNSNGHMPDRSGAVIPDRVETV